ncbi:MAG: dUTP diphosphatase [Candidatus Omnitrophota bacterium]
MKKAVIKIRRKPGCEDLPLPKYMSIGASGMDLYADVDGSLVVNHGEIKMVSAGIYLSIPTGFEAQIRPRSGLAIKHGIGILNSPGTIDSDYRGLINIIIINLGREPYIIKRGVRIAQMVINAVIQAQLEEVEVLDETNRSGGGFGHTGL